MAERPDHTLATEIGQQVNDPIRSSRTPEYGALRQFDCRRLGNILLIRIARVMGSHRLDPHMHSSRQALEPHLRCLLTVEYNIRVDKLRKLRVYVRTMGPAKLCFFLLRWLLIKASGGTIAFHCYHVFLEPVSDSRLLPERWRTALNVRPLGTANADLACDLSALAALHPAAPIDEFRGRLAVGDICLAAYRSDRMVGYVWLRFGPFEETEVRCRMMPTPYESIAWAGNIFIPAQERGGIVLAALCDGADEIQRSKGCRWTASQVSAFNVPSLRAVISRPGSRRIGRLLFFCVGPCQLMLATIPPHVHLACRRSTMPTVAIQVPDGMTGAKA